MPGVLTALEGRPGPVHLNFALREPLVLDGPLPPADEGPSRRAALGDAPAARRPPRRAELVDGLAAELAPARAPSSSPAGRSATPSSAPPWPRSPSGAQVPLLADPLSGARRGAAAVAHYDALLRDPGWAAAHAPDLVLRVGDLPTSKPLRQWLAGLDGALQMAFDAENAWQDPTGSVATLAGGRPARHAGRSRRARASTVARTARPRHGSTPGTAPTGPPPAAIARALTPAGLSEPRVAAELGARPARRRHAWSSPPRCRSATPRRSSPPASDPPRVLVQPRRQRHRRHGLDRLRGRGGDATARSCC